MSEYQKQATDFLTKTNTTLTWRLHGIVKGFPNYDDNQNPRHHFKVVLENAKGMLSIDYYGSVVDCQEGKKTISAYDVLASLSYNVNKPYESMREFAEELGYKINTEKAFKNMQRIHKEVKRQYENLVIMFSKEELEELQAIN